jgi:transposase
MRVSTVISKLLGITSLRVQDVHFEPGGLVIEATPSWRKPRCGRCTRRGPTYDTSPLRRWRHLAFGRTPFWIRYPPRRVSCASCQGVYVEQVPWAGHDSRFTWDFEEMAAYLAQRMDKTAVCTLLGINWRTVGTIVQRVVAERVDPSRLEGLYVIGVDEISFRRHHQYVTCVVDHLKGRVVWTGEGKSAQTLGGFFDELGEEKSKALTHVTMDMSAAFISAVEERAPQAQKVFDRFHVEKLATEAVDEVRRAEVRAAAEKGAAQTLKHSRWALLKKPWNMSQQDGERLRNIQKTNQRLYRAYLLKESLGEGLDFQQLARATSHLDQWIAWALRSRLNPFVKLAHTLKRLKEGVLAYVSTRLSNGLVEGLNNKIRLITRRAYGFHSARALSAMIHLCCGGIVLDPPLPKPTYTA